MHPTIETADPAGLCQGCPWEGSHWYLIYSEAVAREPKAWLCLPPASVALCPSPCCPLLRTECALSSPKTVDINIRLDANLSPALGYMPPLGAGLSQKFRMMPVCPQRRYNLSPA